ncbi:hypothetical protein N7449_003514 [Penicillium cf. viridicatum]|uniref:Zn(2)-C6 fungal-type domain-containing protein n=1 Tax=Penicillium cf. viridicatum TaxID=2972119 RepID=A0A9W9T5C7_9EURO|nr:hypothetical protein N7449_003514 [Penicillium cf. viridicatum]
MDPTAVRHIQSPPGITKPNKQGRRAGKIACTACHARKKRCDISPPYHQCTHCRKEDQCCIPRDSIDRLTNPLGRPTRRRMSNRNHNSQQASNNHETQFHVNGFLPRGIDHEIPRWSAVYSHYSEIRRLLPSLTSTFPSPSPETEEDIAHMQTTPKERKRNASSSGMGSSRRFQSDVLYRDCVEPTSSIKGISIPASRSRSPSPAPVGERVGLEKALACEAEMHGNLTSMREVRVPNGGDSDSAHDIFMNDLDALLRF